MIYKAPTGRSLNESWISGGALGEHTGISSESFYEHAFSVFFHKLLNEFASERNELHSLRLEVDKLHSEVAEIRQYRDSEIRLENELQEEIEQLSKKKISEKSLRSKKWTMTVDELKEFFEED